LKEINQYVDEFKKIDGLTVAVNQKMASYTSFQVGGPADILLIPKNEDAFLTALQLCADHHLPVFVMGNGSNLVVRDKGIRGVVIKLAGGLIEMRVEGNRIIAQAGVMLSKLSRFAAQHGLSGMEFAEGIPGTFGGAIAMNAGAYGGEMKDVVTQSLCVDVAGNRFILDHAQHQFEYRDSFVKRKNLYVIHAELLLEPQENGIILKKMKEFSNLRTSKQPTSMPSAGSTFKRPVGQFAGQLIESCGLKGHQIGGAAVSTKHSGFIVNCGDATAEDITELIATIQEKVFQEKGVHIETEVLIVGEE